MCAENVAELLKLRNVEMQGCHMWCARERSWIIIAIHSSAWGLNFGVHRLTLPLRAAVASGKRSQLLAVQELIEIIGIHGRHASPEVLIVLCAACKCGIESD